MSLGRLGDYPSMIWDRTSTDSGNNGIPVGLRPGQISGPLVPPIKKPACGAPSPEEAARLIDCIRQDVAAGREVQSQMFDMLAPDFMPKGAIPLQAISAGPQSLAAVGQSGVSFTTLATLQADDQYDGFITGLQMCCYPQSSWPDVQWRITINDDIVPKFNVRTMPLQQMASMFNFRWYFPPRATIRLQAANAGATALLADGGIFGWQVKQRSH